MRENLEAFLQTYDGNPITTRELSERTGIKLKTIRNNPKRYEKLGVILAPERLRGAAKEKAKASIIGTKELKSFPSRSEVLKVAINALRRAHNVPATYDASDLKFKCGYRVSKKALTSYITRAKDELNLSLEEYLAVEETLGLKDLKSVHVSPEIEEATTTAFFTVMPMYTPDAEQLQFVYKCYNKLQSESKFAYTIQSVAGTSKTTCINALVETLRITGKQLPVVVSKTNLAVSNMDRAITLYSYLSNKLGFSGFGVKTSVMIKAAKMKLSLGDIEKEDSIIVDEYGILTEEENELLRLLSKRIIYVGDLSQISSTKSLLAPILHSLTVQYRFLGAKSSGQTDMTKARQDFNTLKALQLIEKHTIAEFGGRVIETYLDSNTISRKTVYPDLEALAEIFKGYADMDSQIVAFSTEACNSINEIANGGKDIKEGSKVLIVNAPKNLGIVNGTIWRVASILEYDSCLCVDSTGVVSKIVPTKHLTLAYAITTLRSQGSQWKKVLCVLGTANKDNFLADAYVAITRASESFEIVKRASVNTERLTASEYLRAEEGCRNKAAYLTGRGIGLNLKDMGLELEEATRAIMNGLGSAYNTKDSEKDSDDVSSKSDTAVEDSVILRDVQLFTTAYCNPSLEVTVNRKGESPCSKTEAEASLMGSRDNMLCEYLPLGNRVVLDCDCKETVEAFADVLDLTEAYVSADRSSAHLIFTTDRLIRSSTTGKGFDILGNHPSSNQLRFIKPNKEWNGKSAIPLTQDILERAIKLRGAK